MKITLINPPMDFNKSLGKAKSIAKYTAMIPMGIAYISAYLKHKGYDTEIIDAYAEGLTIDDIEKRINGDIVGISCVTPTYPIVAKIANRLTNKIVVVGGSHPTILPDETISNPDIDAVVVGDGEQAMEEIINGKRGIIQGKTCNLDDLPFPDYSDLPLNKYKAPPHWAIQEPVYYIFATRGCPYHCTFCAAELMGRKRRLRSIDNLMAEIEWLVSIEFPYKAKQIMFQDTCFPLEKDYAYQFCNEMIKSKFNKKVVWTTSTRVDRVDKPLLEIMYKSGCRIINYGLESGNQAILDNIRKGFTLQQARKALELTHKAKIKSFGSFILGLPEDSVKTCLETISFAKKLPLDYAQFYLCVPYPGSQIYNEWKDKTDNWEKYTTMGSFTDNVVYVPDDMTAQQLKDLQKRAYREFYFRPRMIWKHLLNIKNLRDINRYFDIGRVLLNV